MDSQGDTVPNSRGLRTNHKLIPEGHFMHELDNHENIIKVEEGGKRSR